MLYAFLIRLTWVYFLNYIDDTNRLATVFLLSSALIFKYLTIGTRRYVKLPPWQEKFRYQSYVLLFNRFSHNLLVRNSFYIPRK